jgi:hypothetical protein
MGYGFGLRFGVDHFGCAIVHIECGIRTPAWVHLWAGNADIHYTLSVEEVGMSAYLLCVVDAHCSRVSCA